jgi:hypothetical protein
MFQTKLDPLDTKRSKTNLKLGKIVVLLYPFDLGKFRPKNIVIL